MFVTEIVGIRNITAFKYVTCRVNVTVRTHGSDIERLGVHCAGLKGLT